MVGRRVHVICFGNELHGDDGFGPAVFRALADQPLPPNCRLFRADTAGLSALDCFEDCEIAVLVDALAGFGEPGSLHALAPADILWDNPAAAWHGEGIAGVLAHLPHAALPAPPETLILGAELTTIAPYSARLSEPVARAVVPCAEQVLSIIRGSTAA
jgi:hydrogenase maturation protease